MNYDFDKVIDRRDTSCIKWDSLNEEFGRDDVIPMWVADMDFTAPLAITEALKNRMEHEVYGYTVRPYSYFEAIIYWLKSRHNWEVERDWIVNTPGVVPALSVAILAFTNPKDKVIIQPPVYHPFYKCIEGNGREVVINNLKLENDRYVMDFEDLEKKIDKDVKMMILCNPHNPVGRVWSLDELKRLGEICLKNNIIIISDEIHSDIVFEPHSHIPLGNISKELSEITITCMAPSKTFNTAGLSTSYAVIPNRKLHIKFRDTLDSLGIGMGNVFGITALEAAYVDGEEWLRQMLIYIEDNMNYMVEFTNNNIKGITVRKPEGTYLAWLDCRGLKMDCEKLKEFMIYEAKVGLSEGCIFGKIGEGYMRMNIGCPRSILEEGLKRIKNAVDKRIG
jgi:cysteine-S-conjugate beta-lyase